MYTITNTQKVTPGSRSPSWHLRCAPHSLWQCHHVASYSIVFSLGIIGFITTWEYVQNNSIMPPLWWAPNIYFCCKTYPFRICNNSRSCVFLFVCSLKLKVILWLRDTLAGVNVIQVFLMCLCLLFCFCVYVYMLAHLPILKVIIAERHNGRCDPNIPDVFVFVFVVLFLYLCFCACSSFHVECHLSWETQWRVWSRHS